MKVLYGVQGTGNGHLARARALVPALRRQNMQVDFIFSGRGRELFFDMEVFGDDWQVFQGATLFSKNGRLQPLKTLFANNPVRFVRDFTALDPRKYDLVISDFEPVSAYAARFRKIPSISLSHQSAFFTDVPKVYGHFGSRLLTRMVAPTRYHLGFHWHHFGQQVLPPLIEPLEALPVETGKYLVYMGFEPLDAIIAFLQPFRNFTFHIFARVDAVRHLDNLVIHPLNHSVFHRHLADCEGVIANAGFELASEALHLGKKLFVKPLLGQYEQLSNALALQYIRQATVVNHLDGSSLTRWLELPAKTPCDFPNVADNLAGWLKAGDLGDASALIDQLWSQMPQPFTYDAAFGRNIRFGMIA